MSNNAADFNNAVNDVSATNPSYQNIDVSAIQSWKKYGVYLAATFIVRFFIGPKTPKKSKQKDSQFKFIAEQLISTLPDGENKIITNTTKQLLRQHRTIEDTQARRRLEHLACRVIKIYLVCVFVLLLLNGLSRIFWQDIFTAKAPLFSDTVLYVLLSTTTINILGLGFIVLKGHFPIQKGNNEP